MTMVDDVELLEAINQSWITFDLSLESLNDIEVDDSVEEDVGGQAILELECLAKVLQQASSQNEMMMAQAKEKQSRVQFSCSRSMESQKSDHIPM